jgi:hypothetical protein
MGVELEKVFSHEVLAALDERIRRIVREEAGGAEDGWLTVKQAAELTSLSVWHVRQFARKLLAEGNPDVYQPSPGRPPLRLRRSALRDLNRRGQPGV